MKKELEADMFKQYNESSTDKLSCIGCKYENEQKSARYDRTSGYNPFRPALIGPINTPHCLGCKRCYYYLETSYTDNRPTSEIEAELRENLRDNYQNK